MPDCDIENEIIYQGFNIITLIILFICNKLHIVM